MSNQIQTRIRTLFLTGGKYTAKQLNAMVGFNDSRKAISVLRSSGMNIRDIRQDNRCKLYWYQSEENQLTLF